MLRKKHLEQQTIWRKLHKFQQAIGPSYQLLDNENKRKRCIITIKNTDELCCARATVTMRAHCHRQEGVDGHRNWENLKRDLPIQEEKAIELHHAVWTV